MYEPNKKFPIRGMLIAKFRREEQLLFSQTFGKGSKNMSFNPIFTHRIRNMKTQVVSVKIKAVIKNDHDDTKELVKGPYETKMPVNLDREDGYKFAVKVFLDSSFTVQSGEVLYKAGFSYMVLRKKSVE